MSAPNYSELLARFIEWDCAGPQYDSCVNSPCPYASCDGCQHPKHPKHALDLALEGAHADL